MLKLTYLSSTGSVAFHKAYQFENLILFFSSLLALFINFYLFRYLQPFISTQYQQIFFIFAQIAISCWIFIVLIPNLVHQIITNLIEVKLQNNR